MRCPLCGIENLPYAKKCDCGFVLKNSSPENQTNDFTPSEVPESYFTTRETRYSFLNSFLAIGKSIRILRGNYDQKAKRSARLMLATAILTIAAIVALVIWRFLLPWNQ